MSLKYVFSFWLIEGLCRWAVTVCVRSEDE